MIQDNSSKRCKKICSFSYTTIFILAIASLVVSLFCDRHSTKFFSVNLGRNHGVEAEIRLNKIETAGNETFVKSRMYIKLLTNVEKVYIEVQDPKHYLGRYKLDRIGTKHTVDDNLYEGEKDLNLYPEKGSRSNFPFDDFTFNLVIQTDPKAVFKAISLYQNVKGFSLSASSKEAAQSRSDGRLVLQFKLSRYLFSKLSFLSIAVFIVFYLFISTVLSKKNGLLVSSLVTLLVSIWTLRPAVTPLVEGVPTTVDYFFLFISVILLFLMGRKIIHGYYGSDS